MDEKARKRKIMELEEFDQEFDQEFEIEGVQRELPKQGLKLPNKNTEKPQNITHQIKGSPPKSNSKDNGETKERQLNQKKKKKKEKKEKSQTKGKEKKQNELILVGPESRTEAENKELNHILPKDIVTTIDESSSQAQCTSIVPQKEASSPPSFKSPSPTFEALTEPSSNTSTSSVIPPAKAPKHIKLPSDPDLLRSRLTARIDALRAARKADGPDGRPARNRQELLEARRRKEEQRRSHKKQLRLKAKAEEEAKREATKTSARSSPAATVRNIAKPPPSDRLSFGRVTFADGQQLTDDLSALKNIPKKRGPQDAGTALIASENKRIKMAGLKEEKRKELEEKDIWLNAKKHVYGEKIRDNPTLLKKTLKRKEKAKKNSEKDWSERIDGVAKAQAMRQKKREENLKQRRDGKGRSRNRHVVSANATKGKKLKTKNRPGFEGSFISGKNRSTKKKLKQL